MNEFKIHGLNADPLEETWRLETRKAWQGQLLQVLLHYAFSGQEHFISQSSRTPEAEHISWNRSTEYLRVGEQLQEPPLSWTIPF